MNILINYPKSGESGPAFVLELAKGLKKMDKIFMQCFPEEFLTLMSGHRNLQKKIFIG